METDKDQRRSFIKGSSFVAAAAALTGCSWKYRGTHSLIPFSEKTGGALAKVEDLKNETATLVYTKKDGPVILVRFGKEVIAYESFCPHTGCELNDGEREQPLDVANNEIRCFLHDSYFDIRTGKRISGPARKGTKLPEYKITVENGMVYKAS